MWEKTTKYVSIFERKSKTRNAQPVIFLWSANYLLLQCFQSVCVYKITGDIYIKNSRLINYLLIEHLLLCSKEKVHAHWFTLSLSLSLSHDMSTCIFSLKAKLAKSSHHTKPIVHCRSWRIIIIHGTLCWKAFTTPSLPILSLIGLWTMRCDG